MFLKSLEVFHFKNLKEKKFLFSSKINGFVGSNGVGKTNILDAIYYLSSAKSYFSTNDQQNITFGEDFFFLEGAFQKGHRTESINCALRKGERKLIKKDGKLYDRITDHIGQYPIVVISPYDRNLITEGSEARRRFIDSVISQLDKKYLQELISYQRALLQRNALLKSIASGEAFHKDSLDIYAHQMHQHGGEIFKKRKNFLEDFSSTFELHYKEISRARESVSILYKSSLEENSLYESISSSSQRDVFLGYTSLGVHKDEFDFLLGDHLIRKIGSQGQQKSFLIALKFAQFDFIKQKIEFPPLLLLDDIFDKLDQDRVGHIVDLVNKSYFGQVFLSDAHPPRTKEILSTMKIEHDIFHLT